MLRSPDLQIQIQMRSWLVWLTFNIPLNVRCPSDGSCSLHNIWFHQWQSWRTRRGTVSGGGWGGWAPGGWRAFCWAHCAQFATRNCAKHLRLEYLRLIFAAFFSAADAGVGNENICWLIAPWSQICSRKNARKGGSCAPRRRSNALPSRSQGNIKLSYWNGKGFTVGLSDKYHSTIEPMVLRYIFFYLYTHIVMNYL